MGFLGQPRWHPLSRNPLVSAGQVAEAAKGSCPSSSVDGDIIVHNFDENTCAFVLVASFKADRPFLGSTSS